MTTPSLPRSSRTLTPYMPGVLYSRRPHSESGLHWPPRRRFTPRPAISPVPSSRGYAASLVLLEWGLDLRPPRRPYNPVSHIRHSIGLVAAHEETFRPSPLPPPRPRT